MANLLLNYTFGDTDFANPDGTAAGSFTNASGVGGPGRTPFGTFGDAQALGRSGKSSVGLSGVATNSRQFCIRIAFRVTSQVTKRQNLAESTKLPFSIAVRENGNPNTFDLTASVGTANHGWSGCSTAHKQVMHVGRWYSATVVYDLDTMALFVDGRPIDLHAFPDGRIEQKADGRLFFGTWVDGRRDKFDGHLAAFQLHDGIPASLERQLDARRDSADWYITYKYEQIKRRLRPGKLTGRPSVSSTVGTTYLYERCAICFHPDAGGAFEMHGAIYAKYKARRDKAALGFLLTDESDGTGRGVKQNLFQKGGIYWSGGTGAQIVTGRIYLEFENQGATRVWGMPTGPARREAGGLVQIFQRCRFYHESGTPRAFEVHGQILQRYLRLGGPRKFGFPVSDEQDVFDGRRMVGKVSEFTACTIYWSQRSGAHEVHGDIRKKYVEELGGALGALGLPTSDEVQIPGLPGAAKMNSFQKGSILWYGSRSSIIVARPFQLFIERIETKESERFGMGQNDLHFYATLKKGATRLRHSRHPRSGDYGDHNHKTVNVRIPTVITPNGVRDTYSLSFDVRDSDPGDDDHLGKKTFVFNAANAWGLRDDRGVFNERFDRVKKLSFSVQPKVDIAALSETDKFWGIRNQRTPAITKDQYASMFRDVDSETEWWDITDGLRNLYYELAVKGVAAGGNCFGFSLEAIEARKCVSLFGMPLSRFDAWNTIGNEINIKQGYQLGASSIWWTVGQFLSGNTHDPVDVYNRSRAAFLRGENPILGISQDYFYSEGGHAILPVKWRKRGDIGTIEVLDSNKPREIRELHVDFRKNEYTYQGTSRAYKGGEWSGGRLVYFPYCLYNRVPRTPMWEAIALFLSGGFLLLGNDVTTESVVDAQGRDLLATGDRAKQALRRGSSATEYFVPIQPTDGIGLNPGQLLARTEKGLTDTDFEHAVKGLRRGGKLEYAMKNGLRELNISAGLAQGEVNTVAYRDAQSVRNLLTVTSPKTKPSTIEFRNRLGVKGDYIRVAIDDVRLAANRELQLNIKPAHGGMEIAAGSSQPDVPVLIETRIDDRINRKTVRLDLRRPLRLTPLSIGGTPQVGVSRLDNLFGPRLDMDVR